MSLSDCKYSFVKNETKNTLYQNEKQKQDRFNLVNIFLEYLIMETNDCGRGESAVLGPSSMPWVNRFFFQKI